MTPIEIYFEIIDRSYNKLKKACQEVCNKNCEKFDEDIFQNTIIKIYDIIQKREELDDMSEQGILNYFVRSYVNNLREQTRYAFFKKRDFNLTDEEIKELFEKGLSNPDEKIMHDLLEDFSVLFLTKMVELNFDDEHYYLYKLKFLCNMTYKQVAQKTNIPKSRDKILEVKRWLNNNFTRKTIKEEFISIYGDLLK